MSKEAGRYLRYIFNSHIVIALIFLIGAGGYYYQAWLKMVGPEFPVPVVMAAFLALLVTYSPIYTFLENADKVFLLPLEDKMGPYFFRALLFSFFIGLYWIVLALAVLMPMYAKFAAGGLAVFLFFSAVLAILKIINLLIRWQIQFYAEIHVHRVDALIRFLINGVFLYLLFSGASYWLLLPLVFLYGFYYLFNYYQTKEKGLKWEFLIEQQERRMMSFYRFANMFTDVPALRNKVKRRKWLDWAVRFVSFKKENVYTYLYITTFLRGGDYFGLYVRLTVIGGVVIYLLPAAPAPFMFAVLFLFLTGFQLFSLWNHHQDKIMPRLYPVRENIRLHSFRRLLLALLWIQSFIFALPVLFAADWLAAGAVFAAGLLFSWLFVYLYLKNKFQL